MFIDYNDQGKWFNVLIYEGAQLVGCFRYKKEVEGGQIHKDIYHGLGDSNLSIKIVSELQTKGWVVNK